MLNPTRRGEPELRLRLLPLLLPSLPALYFCLTSPSLSPSPPFFLSLSVPPPLCPLLPLPAAPPPTLLPPLPLLAHASRVTFSSHDNSTKRKYQIKSRTKKQECDHGRASERNEGAPAVPSGERSWQRAARGAARGAAVHSEPQMRSVRRPRRPGYCCKFLFEEAKEGEEEDPLCAIRGRLQHLLMNPHKAIKTVGQPLPSPLEAAVQPRLGQRSGQTSSEGPLDRRPRPTADRSGHSPARENTGLSS